MNNIKPLALAGLILLIQQAYAQYETSWDNSERSINRISEHVYRWGGGAMGGISGLFVPTSEGIIVIDGPGNPCTPDSGQWFKDELEQRYDVPVRYVVLSHDHQSHICGTTVFADTAVAIGFQEAQAAPDQGGAHCADPDGLVRGVAGYRPRRRKGRVVLLRPDP